MDVLNEILKWSQARPNWQREALRRLVQKGSLDQDDVNELVIHCKAAHGLADKLPFIPLSGEHIPNQSGAGDAIVLNTLTHEKGVNALANNQTIKFGKGLSVVYGQNAAGKSGYTRVLKKACRARGSEDILGNVLSERAPSKPSAVLNYSIGPNEFKWNWTDTDSQDPALGNVSVFDRHCATVYLSQKTDVAFRPFGLDLFDKLAACCEKIRAILEKERQELNKVEFQLTIPPGTNAYDLTSEIKALTNLDTIRAAANLSQSDLDRAKELKTQIRELSDEDLAKHKRELELRLKRIQGLRENLTTIESALSSENLTAIQKSQIDATVKGKVAKDLEAQFVKFSKLEGTGSEEWQALWNSASEFSKLAYPKNDFPFTKKGANCVLCQQELDNSAVDRFNSFQKLMASSAQHEADEAKADLETRADELNELLGLELLESDSLSELGIENEVVAEELSKAISDFKSKAQSIIKQIGSSKKIEKPNFRVDLGGLNKVEKNLQQRIKSLSAPAAKNELTKLRQELAELEGRKVLKESLPAISKEIERQKKMAVYSVCVGDVGTTGITKKSTEVTKEVVTEHLVESFHKELAKLGFDHLEIDLQTSGASRGALYHKLVIKRAVNIEVQNVVSEGEARALSIAAFFAELSTASNRSGILFDDPVSSLDHLWREKIARRLAEEAQGRQVIVFTHDIVFLSSLSRIADELKVDLLHQYIHREHEGAGVSSQDLPWVAMRVRDRIGVLKRKLQDVVKIEKSSPKEVFEKEAAHLYGLLREAWERGLEEVLIGGVIERYRPSVQSLKVKQLADITQKDCETFDAGMTKCSKWLPGHDNSAAESSPFPNAAELASDIESLEVWVKEITKRRS